MHLILSHKRPALIYMLSMQSGEYLPYFLSDFCRACLLLENPNCKAEAQSPLNLHWAKPYWRWNKCFRIETWLRSRRALIFFEPALMTNNFKIWPMLLTVSSKYCISMSRVKKRLHYSQSQEVLRQTECLRKSAMIVGISPDFGLLARGILEEKSQSELQLSLKELMTIAKSQIRPSTA